MKNDTQNIDDTILNACGDGIPQEMVWKRTETAGSDALVDLPTKVDLNRTTVFSQYLKTATNMGCTVYGNSHTKHDTENKVSTDPEALWNDAVNYYGASRQYGWSLQAAINMFLDKKLIEGYAIVNGVDEMKQALASGSALYTGTRKCDWRATRARSDLMFVFTERGAGHAYEISGYDDNWKSNDGKYTGAFECKNSNTNFPVFWIPYTMIQHLYSTIVLIGDKYIVEKKKMTENEKTIKYAIEQGITNGEELDHPATRGQIAVMLGRLLNGTEHSYDELIQMTTEQGLWNGQDQHRSALRYEAMIMVARYIVPEENRSTSDHNLINFLVKGGITNGHNQGSTVTRREAILLITRSFMKVKGVVL